MSDPKLISPMLDNFAMGDPISSHDGVCCCPAMKDGCDTKYIVKIISIPAAQSQLDALLIAGAYPNVEAADDYFLDTARDLEKEVGILSDLARGEGFLPYEALQIVPMEDEIGYDIYLLSPYKRSLAKHFKRSPMTHLGAINLGIDLCGALAACRKAGYLYVDLKPANIFLGEDGRYRIGDLGLLSLNSLRFTALPQRCRSSWTAPEMADPMALPNTTMDIYALGLVLYQAYNNGALPYTGSAPDEVLPPPMYADYELAEIILKACDPNPEQRWQEPEQMQQALVAYMQRNGANDTPIIPPQNADPEPEPYTLSEDDASDKVQSAEDASQAVSPFADPEGEDALNLIKSLVSDETAPSDENAEGLSEASLTDEGSDILTQAEDLIAHEAPGPAVAPDPIDVPMPEPILPEKDEEELVAPEDVPAPDLDEAQDAEEEEVPELSDEEIAERKRQVRAKTRRIVKRVVTTTLIVLLLAVLTVGSWYFYQDYYLQEVRNVTLEGFEETLTVHVDSEADESLLTVRLTDTFGNMREAKVVDGVAKFDKLEASSQFSIQLEISGLHKLKGNTTYAYATQARTNIVSFTAKAGSEDGSVILNFTVDGPDIEEWTIGYITDGEQEQFVSFPGHMVTVNGLTVGKTYQFRLVPTKEIYLVGEDYLEFSAVKVLLAENLEITGCADGKLTASWSAPADGQVNSWVVRCYNDAGYDQTLTTSELSIAFEDIDSTKAHTIEVTAEGMTLCARAYVTANPLTITQIHGGDQDPNQYTFSWDFTGPAPEGGWLLLYTLNDSEDQKIIQCEDASAVVAPKIPGMSYKFTLQAANGSTVFGGNFSAEAEEAELFVSDLFGASAENMSFKMCRTPEKEDWDRDDLNDEDFTTDFKVGEKASFSVWLSKEYNPAHENVTTLYLIRDENNNPVVFDSETREWYDMWYQGYCQLNIPNLPVQPGTYTIDIFFNGAIAGSQEFTISAAE